MVTEIIGTLQINCKFYLQKAGKTFRSIIMNRCNFLRIQLLKNEDFFSLESYTHNNKIFSIKKSVADNQWQK